MIFSVDVSKTSSSIFLIEADSEQEARIAADELAYDIEWDYEDLDIYVRTGPDSYQGLSPYYNVWKGGETGSWYTSGELQEESR